MRWEYRCFVPHSVWLTAAALDAAELSRESSERRGDQYYALDDDHGLKRRGCAQDGTQLELKTCTARLPDGSEHLSHNVITRDGGWKDENGPLDPALAAAIDASVAGCGVRVHKERWARQAWAGDGQGQGQLTRVEVTELTLTDGEKFVSVCCEGETANVAAEGGAALQRAVLEAAHLPRRLTPRASAATQPGCASARASRTRQVALK